MRILILAPYFAPTNTIAAHRLTALTQYLSRHGHEIKVVAARHDDIPRDLAADLTGIEVIETRLSPLAGMGRSRPQAHASPSGAGNRRPPLWPRGLLRTLRHLLVWPDARAGWLWLALPAALRTVRRWRPDVIYASSPPATCMALGAIVSKLTGVPWICEIRDRWADDPYTPRPAWRRAGERRLERTILGSARAIVTVSQTWAADYGARHGKPALAVYSGFDPAVYEHIAARPEPGLPLRIVYTGSVYAGRDPAPLWRALAAMGERADDIRVEFYGARRGEVLPGAAAYGVERLVHVEEYVAHERAVEQQCGADVLLLLQWDNPSEAGNMPGKLFEYLGARRPILAIGYAGGEMARVIVESEAGVCANDAAMIARKLVDWSAQKQEPERHPADRRPPLTQFTRNAQFQKLERCLCSW